MFRSEHTLGDFQRLATQRFSLVKFSLVAQEVGQRHQPAGQLPSSGALASPTGHLSAVECLGLGDVASVVEKQGQGGQAPGFRFAKYRLLYLSRLTTERLRLVETPPIV